MNKKGKEEKKTKERIWMPKCKAQTFAHKNSKRNKTRSDKFRNALKDQE